METLVKILHVIVCLFLMLTVLLQAGKGGGMGAAFGGGSSMGTVFGGSGAGNFLRRLTVGAAVIFMITSMTLAWMATPSTDPLEKYWAQQHKAALDREKAHDQALDTEKQAPAAGDKAAPAVEGEGVAPDEMTGDEIDTGDQGTTGDEVETPAEGDSADAVETPDTSAKEAAPGETSKAPAPRPPDAKKAPAEKPAPQTRPVPPPASPVAPPPESSTTP